MNTQTTIDNMTENNTAIKEENTTMNNYKYNEIVVRNMDQYIDAVESGQTCNSIRKLGLSNNLVYRYLLIHSGDSDRHMMLYAHCLMNECAENSLSRLSATELHNKGISIISQLADSGFGEAMYWMGMYHRMGVYVDSDKPKAINYIVKASQVGFADAMIELAMHYSNGDGVELDESKAIQLYSQAAELGADTGLFGLAYSTDSIDERIALLQQAADNGHRESMVELARMYSKGDILPKDTAKAIQLYQSCIDSGDIFRGHRIADIYLASDNASDKLKAVELYRDMAGQGNTTALCRLAEIYLKGEIVPQDIAKAYSYYDIAGEVNSVATVRCLLKAYADKCGPDVRAEFDRISIEDNLKYMVSYTHGE